MTPREQRILKFFAEKWREWNNTKRYCDDHAELRMQLASCSEDLDEFMVEEFESDWFDAKAGGSK